MIDVHEPEHRISGKRDFFLHLFTITIGLLIALGLENAAEAWHHRHQRQEAEETIRQELKDNRDNLKQMQTVLGTEMNRMVRVLAFLNARQHGQPGDVSGLTLAYEERPLQEAAWHTASATGVLAYMDYAEVQFAMAYHIQEAVLDMQQQTLEEYLELDSYVVDGFDPKTFSQDDARTATPIVRRTLAHLGATRDMVRGALDSYKDALK